MTNGLKDTVEQKKKQTMSFHRLSPLLRAFDSTNKPSGGWGADHCLILRKCFTTSSLTTRESSLVQHFFQDSSCVSLQPAFLHYLLEDCLHRRHLAEKKAKFRTANNNNNKKPHPAHSCCPGIIGTGLAHHVQLQMGSLHSTN